MIVRVDDLFAGEHQDIVQDVRAVVADPENWLDMPNDRLGGRKPRELVGTREEIHLRNLIRAIQHGIPT
jgi:hypothetical protein